MMVEASENVGEHDSVAYLMARPETIALTPAPNGGVGVVLSSTFHGHTVDYEVETSSGTLSVAEANPDPRRLLAEGTNVDITIDPDRAYILHREYRPSASRP
jgi:iron(III) transport system ATP-binding protein